MVLWTKRFATGSDTIDQQHRMLINNINHLEAMLTNTNPSRTECDFLIHLVDFLETYADHHFKFEEGCMERHHCPAHTRNKEAHGQFLQFISNYKARVKVEGFRQEALVQLHSTLGKWIEEHILRIDTQLKPCL